MSEHATEFARHRPAVLGAAYRILGTAHDAEDVAQETWLRWSRVDLSTVREPQAYLVRAASRLALNALRDQSRRRES
ncbi:MAG: sigma factor, partial [Nocardioidaceae bacterium]